MIIHDPKLGKIDTENFTKEDEQRIIDMAKKHGHDLTEENEFIKEMRKQLKS
jgi:hypothetical protein